MNIKNYIEQPISTNQAESIRLLAKKLGKPENTVKNWVYGNNYPSRKMWRKIEEATNGQVTAEELARGAIERF